MEARVRVDVMPVDLTSQMDEMKREAGAAIAAADSLGSLEQVKLRYLGKKGALTSILRGMAAVTAAERPLVGRLANELRDHLEGLLAARERELAGRERESRLAAEALDVTLPGRRSAAGRRHPLTVVWEELEAVFRGMGFEVFEGPEIEYDSYNFEALNIPRDHPARDMQDSFYITDEILLRTHTSPAQIRFMRRRAPRLPVRMIAPGRVYRRDDDATHSPVFHQLEGLLVDEGISLGDLKGTLLAWARQMYGETARIRLRPSYFPFTEPSAEVDVSCTICGAAGTIAGQQCRACKGTGWLEILGAGMVHPVVLRNGGYDPEKVSGFAFGMGMERIAMLKYGIDDLRLFFQNDLRFLHQF